MSESDVLTKAGPQITRLANVAGSDPAAAEELLGAIYDTLRCWARNRLRDERAGNLVGATALVHEAYSDLFLSPQPASAKTTQERP